MAFPIHPCPHLLITRKDMTMTEKSGTHKDLIIWQDALTLVEQVYGFTTDFPSHEMYGLTSQMRRAAVSVASNIAEGAARQTAKEFIQFLYMALGSLSELETQCIIAVRLTYLPDEGINGEIEQLRRKLLSFIKYRKERVKGL